MSASPSGERLNHYLASRGVASRRGADALIEAGRVAVNGHRAPLGMTVDPATARVTVDGRPVPPVLPQRTVMVNKPRGVVSTRHDRHGRPTILDLVDDPNGLFPVGRLDRDSRGLLLLTTRGALALRLTHPRYGVEKRYRVTVRGRASRAVLRRIVAGMELDDGPARALRAEVVATDRDAGDVVEVVMAEGRKREVRRLVAAAGAVVIDLQRTGFGPLRLGRLREGSSRPLTRSEEAVLHRAVSLPPR